MAAALAGLFIGHTLAPLLADPGNGLLGSPGSLSLTVTSALLVIATAVVMAAARC